MTSVNDDDDDDSDKRPLSCNNHISASASKRVCTSPRSNPMIPARLPPSIESILHLPKDAVSTLRKQDLRTYFLTLQQYAQNPYPLPTPRLRPCAAVLSPVQPDDQHLPHILNLPVEIRDLIYAYTLPPVCNLPIRGPHPRQLQTHIHLTQPIVPALLLLNRQVRNEALPLLYGAPTQIVHVKIDYNVWLHKTRRSELILSSALTACIKHIHVSIHLGSEKRTTKPGDVEADARIAEVKKGIKKLGKWLAGADVQTLKVNWQEPPQTYTWEQKRDILDGLRVLRAVKVDAGEINWGLNWNKGKKFRFEIEHLKELERERQVNGAA